MNESLSALEFWQRQRLLQAEQQQKQLQAIIETLQREQALVLDGGYMHKGNKLVLCHTYNSAIESLQRAQASLSNGLNYELQIMIDFKEDWSKQTQPGT
ncbi:MAG: hypothetical protein V4543_00835 [Bacteroidota bacterium]